jgi:hypothetical protein
MPRLMTPVFVRRFAKAGLMLTLWCCALLNANGQTVSNTSFELPALTPNSFLYGPFGATWIFARQRRNH